MMTRRKPAPEADEPAAAPAARPADAILADMEEVCRALPGMSPSGVETAAGQMMALVGELRLAVPATEA